LNKETGAVKAEQKDVLSWPLVILVAVVLWPIATLIILIYFGVLLKGLFEEMEEVSLKVGTISFAAKSAQPVNAPHVDVTESKVSGMRGVEPTDKPRRAQTLDGSHILWVDDRPSNNVGERATFEKMGIRFTVSTSTEDALQKVRLHQYDAIISDMGRPPDDRAGYTLLDRLLAMEVDTPFVIYSSSNRPEHKAEALRKGAVGATNNLPELVELVKAALLDGGKPPR
jgi:CheY-like chemotaxis protein